MQDSLFEKDSPSELWDQDITRRALDELFSLARQYKSGRDYLNLLEFVARFRFYSPYNAMLIHVQMPGATYVAPPHRWLNGYRRRIKPSARPLVILQPMGPVMFVFDVSETEPMDGAPPLPDDVVNPFAVRQGKINGELAKTIENALRDGISVSERETGSQHAGQISVASPGSYLSFTIKQKPNLETQRILRRYELLLNAKLTAEEKFATLAHELGHLYCGHLGTPNEKWWPNRRGLSHKLREFEAESVCFLVCQRLGVDNPSEKYLSGYLRDGAETPSISLECVMKASGLIEQMSRARLKPRKETE
jgi:hypothetical protein